MKGFFRSNTFKILLIVILILSAIFILSITTGETSLGNVLGLVTTPMQEVSTAISGDDGTNKLESMTRQELEKYCETLLTENTGLRGQLVDYYGIKQKNRQYQEALKIQEQNLDLEMLPATVIGRDPGNDNSTFSIDLGYTDGIREGDPVITEKGVVGVVSKTYATSGLVTSILSEDVKIGAVSKELQENGVVKGDIQAASTGCVRMDYLTKESEIQQGTVITTSGAGGIFPRDLIIGRVSFLGSSQTDVSLYAIIEPYEDIGAVSDVFIITNFPGKNEEAPPLPTDEGASK
ncbi:MAG: rod shape-determining protein MreC [Oscillospiraceae bacterium]